MGFVCRVWSPETGFGPQRGGSRAICGRCGGRPLKMTASDSVRQDLTKKAPDEDGKKLRIRPRDFVVHADYGVGKFLGTAVEDEEKFAVVQYEDGLLNVPITEAKSALSLFKPREVESKPKLGKMANRTAWLRTVSKARKAAQEMALNLVKLYSVREQIKRPPYDECKVKMKPFNAAWGHTPTSDQAACFEDVQSDLCGKDKPMDRLICGDVGFGKTEVAIRAAYLAVANGKQVVVLAPTTVLVLQHFRTFLHRMESFGVKIRMHTRFVGDADKAELLDEASRGEVDVIIATHGLLQHGQKIPNLGLMIIDEEQRFGVQQKEQFKSYRTSLDVLTLSATPIPRTMYMGLSGVRDMSLLRTPPPLRRAIDTSVVGKQDPSVNEAVTKELQRNGQVFIVTPRVRDLKGLSAWLEADFPEAQVIVAHGRVKDLEKKMHDFATGEADILVSTTIIESGIDIPRVNTLIVNRADMFGMAQLYQLRGRVGRSSHQAFALFTYEDPNKIGADALRRLYYMEEYNDLGSSFELAKRDLEIRGSGALYGFEQSGAVSGVGVELYMDYLRESVSEWKIVQRFVQTEEPKIMLSKAVPKVSKSFIQDDVERAELEAEVLDCTTLEELDLVKKKAQEMPGTFDLHTETFFVWKELYIIFQQLGISEIRNHTGTHLSMASRMPDICWKKIMRDALEIPNEAATKTERSAVREFLMKKCKFVDSKGLVVQGLGGRPPSAQIRSLVRVFRPLALAACKARAEVEQIQGGQDSRDGQNDVVQQNLN